MASGIDLGRYSKRVVQYFWDPMPKNDDSSPIWCLGRRYDCDEQQSRSRGAPVAPPSAPPGTSPTAKSEAPSLQADSAIAGNTSTTSSLANSGTCDEQSANSEVDGGWPASFLDDFESRLWLTYRSNFPPIARSQEPNAASAMSFSTRLKQLGNTAAFTSDTGWGCMIRSGQSLLANALVMLRLGRDWRKGSNSEDERSLVSLFADDPKAPFSIHKFVEHGASACGKHPGEWFGPSATARCIHALSSNHPEAGLRVYVTSDSSDVYEDSFMKVARSPDDAHNFHPTLLLLGIRLGIDRVTPVYRDALKAALHMEQSIGIAGGRPSSSHYFIGTQGSHFFYLDPHYTRPAIPLQPSPADVDSCHTRRQRRLHIKEMDPSMLIAFLIRDEADWLAWRKTVTAVQGKAIIHVHDKEPTYQGVGGGVERQSAIDEVEVFGDTDEEDGENGDAAVC
ncbi:Cysteine protease atg4 [Oleoguttula sp. CCFEE 6159]|nr:Cysteine protease atg4 [Oleoguttula sp. CCFEE 6159]